MMALGGVAGVTTVQRGFKDACVVGAVTITEQNRGGGLVLWNARSRVCSFSNSNVAGF